ncbi:potassium transporter Kup [Leeia sp. TBRC 13508]|uniref:Probable potassium transport system protein Kup n=1 Tax=Leeia speluncae TaxID=2884804 RepID=A0ABS8D631_9NEIS|nr:potassium transporter Kup [Leeia speluncae]MCB6183650.1 potassium transporter Kup [Leeia speluncae]
MSSNANGHRTQGVGALVLGAIGVVYGDIGTSPLYTLKECFGGSHKIPFSPDSVYGILSLIFWALMIVVSIKYVIFIMRADNNGEGGILALMALALRGTERTRTRWFLMVLGIFGASMFFGDGMITPAVSVLSAVEGLTLINPALEHYVLPVAIAVLIGLFAIQRFGTASVGKLFGPIMLLWFGALGVLGLTEIVSHPMVLKALNPYYAITFIVEHKIHAFFVMGSVVLAITGAEALYADMGHFGSFPIRAAWFGFVLPALVLNYFGQGALIINDPTTVVNPFYLLVPESIRWMMIILATFATVIASQAVISGAFSVARQAVQLGYCPRLDILHTSEQEIGQIYIPFINWLLMLIVILLVVSFKSSSNLAAAYGIAVTTEMVMATILTFVVMRRIWKWHIGLISVGIALLLIVDLTFFAANAIKIPEGGWFPLAIGAVTFTLLTTWKRGRELLFQRLSEDALPLDMFVESVGAHPPHQVEGTAVFMTGSRTGVPHALLHNLKHNKVLHERNVLLTVATEDVPYIEEKDRLKVESLGYNFWRIEATYGFKEEPDIHQILGLCESMHELSFDMMETSFFLARETLIASKVPGMAIWREKLFVWMSKNATKATDFFKIPTNRVVELGTQVEL